MADNKAKTALKARGKKKDCPSCGSESRVEYYTGFGKRGYFWICEQSCGFSQRTR